MNASPDRVDSSPSTLRWAVRLLYGEAAATAAVTAFLVWSDVTAPRTDLRVALGVTVVAALAAIALAAIARSLSRRRPGARGPAIVLQIMLIVIGYYMVQGDLDWLGAVLIVLGLTVGGLIVSPPTTRALGLG